MSKMKIITPKSMIIENVSGEMAGVFYDAARSSGMTIIKLRGKTINLLKYKSARMFARANLEAFIPDAVKHLTQIMSRSNTPVETKDLIYQAIMERVNDPQLDELGKVAGLPEFDQKLLYKDDSEKPKPIIINAIKDTIHGKEAKVTR